MTHREDEFVFKCTLKEIKKNKKLTKLNNLSFLCFQSVLNLHFDSNRNLPSILSCFLPSFLPSNQPPTHTSVTFWPKVFLLYVLLLLLSFNELWRVSVCSTVCLFGSSCKNYSFFNVKSIFDQSPFSLCVLKKRLNQFVFLMTKVEWFPIGKVIFAGFCFQHFCAAFVSLTCADSGCGGASVETSSSQLRTGTVRTAHTQPSVSFISLSFTQFLFLCQTPSTHCERSTNPRQRRHRKILVLLLLLLCCVCMCDSQVSSFPCLHFQVCQQDFESSLFFLFSSTHRRSHCRTDAWCVCVG